MVETAGGYLAIGSASNATGCGLGLPPCIAVVFTSSDGRAWQQRAITIPAGLNTPDAFTDAVAIGGRILAISQEGDGQTQVQPSEPVIDASGANFWSSIDGVTWTPIDSIPLDYGPSPYQPLAAGPNRVVMVGDINARIVVSPKG